MQINNIMTLNHPIGPITPFTVMNQPLSVITVSIRLWILLQVCDITEIETRSVGELHQGQFQNPVLPVEQLTL